MKTTLIGDCHSKIYTYKSIAEQHQFTVQLGDFGFYQEYRLLRDSGLNPAFNKILLGNHDDYANRDVIRQFDLGDFGIYRDIFFIRGGSSIDVKYRKEYINYWPEENLEFRDFKNALALYDVIKPRIVISHTCPNSIAEKMFGPLDADSWGLDSNWKCTTQVALDSFLEVWQPSLWVFGHFHQTKTMKAGNTKFQCLEELDTLTVDTDAIGL